MTSLSQLFLSCTGYVTGAIFEAGCIGNRSSSPSCRLYLYFYSETFWFILRARANERIKWTHFRRLTLASPFTIGYLITIRSAPTPSSPPEMRKGSGFALLKEYERCFRSIQHVEDSPRVEVTFWGCCNRTACE